MLSVGSTSSARTDTRACASTSSCEGRAGRQGDPGSSRFFISLEDDLIVRYGVRNLIPPKLLPKEQDEPLDNPVIRREIARAQRIVEGQNVETRKTLYGYSSVSGRAAQDRSTAAGGSSSGSSAGSPCRAIAGPIRGALCSGESGCPGRGREADRTISARSILERAPRQHGRDSRGDPPAASQRPGPLRGVRAARGRRLQRHGEPGRGGRPSEPSRPSRSRRRESTSTKRASEDRRLPGPT